jgi:hypothetical protein
MKKLILSFILFATLSCNKDDNQSVTNPTNVTLPITSVLIGKSSITDPNPPLQNSLISTQSQWDALLLSMNAINNVSNNFTGTNINFNVFDVIAVFRNPISNSSSTVDIISIEENQTNRVVTVRNLINGISSDISQPFHIVKIPKSTKPVIFI